MKMIYAAVLAAGMAIFWAGGCQEEQVSSDVKQSRLIAAENGDLKRQFREETKNLNSQMQKRDDEIKNLNSQMQKRDEEITSIAKQLQAEKEKLNALSKRLAECAQEKQAAMDKAEKDIKKQSDDLTEMMIPLIKETQELRTENEQLKEELSNCKGKK